MHKLLLKHQTHITGSNDVTCALLPGNYFVSLQTNVIHKVEKNDCSIEIQYYKIQLFNNSLKTTKP